MKQKINNFIGKVNDYCSKNEKTILIWFAIGLVVGLIFG